MSRAMEAEFERHDGIDEGCTAAAQERNRETVGSYITVVYPDDSTSPRIEVAVTRHIDGVGSSRVTKRIEGSAAELLFRTILFAADHCGFEIERQTRRAL